MTVKSEYCDVLSSATQQKRSMMLLVEGHAVIKTAAFHWVLADHTIGGRIDLRHFVGRTQSHVDLFCNGVVSRRPGFGIEPQNLYNLVSVDVYHADRFAQRIHDIYF